MHSSKPALSQIGSIPQKSPSIDKLQENVWNAAHLNTTPGPSCDSSPLLPALWQSFFL